MDSFFALKDMPFYLVRNFFLVLRTGRYPSPLAQNIFTRQLPRVPRAGCFDELNLWYGNVEKFRKFWYQFFNHCRYYAILLHQCWIGNRTGAVPYCTVLLRALESGTVPCSIVLYGTVLVQSTRRPFVLFLKYLSREYGTVLPLPVAKISKKGGFTFIWYRYHETILDLHSTGTVLVWYR